MQYLKHIFKKNSYQLLIIFIDIATRITSLPFNTWLWFASDILSLKLGLKIPCEKFIIKIFWTHLPQPVVKRVSNRVWNLNIWTFYRHLLVENKNQSRWNSVEYYFVTNTFRIFSNKFFSFQVCVLIALTIFILNWQKVSTDKINF